MKKSAFWFSLLLVVFLVPAVVSAQYYIPPGAPTPSTLFAGLPSIGLPGFPSLNLGCLRWNTNIDVGYEVQAWNLNFPFEDVGTLTNVDLGIPNADFWVGTVGMTIDLPQGAGVFFDLTGSVREKTDYALAGGGWITAHETKGNSQYWLVNLGAAMEVRPGIVALVGYKFDQFSGTAEWESAPVGFWVEDLDLQLKTRSIYFGARLGSPAANMTLTCSPWLANVEMRVPLREIIFGPPVGLLDTYNKINADGAVMFDAQAKARFTPVMFPSTVSVNVWGKASYLAWRGSSKQIIEQAGFDYFGPIPGEYKNGAYVGRYVLGFGLGGTVLF